MKANLELMDKLGFYFGAKIVRGAYMAQERNHAADMGYDDPIHNSYEDTCSMYNQVVETVLQRVSHTPAEVMVASHNEESVQLAVQRYGNIPIIFKYYTVSFKFVHTNRDLPARKQSHACPQENVARTWNGDSRWLSLLSVPDISHDPSCETTFRNYV